MKRIGLLVKYLFAGLFGITVTFGIAWLIGLVWSPATLPVFIVLLVWLMWCGWLYAQAQDRGDFDRWR
jgi:hypothetical protein